jgi:hypothetical protein
MPAPVLQRWYSGGIPTRSKTQLLHNPPFLRAFIPVCSFKLRARSSSRLTSCHHHASRHGQKCQPHSCGSLKCVCVLHTALPDSMSRRTCCKAPLLHSRSSGERCKSAVTRAMSSCWQASRAPVMTGRRGLLENSVPDVWMKGCDEQID